MDFFYYLKYILSKVLYLFGYKLMLGEFVFSIGDIFLGFFVLICSATLLGYLLHKD